MALHGSSAGKWYLEVIVTNWLSQISNVTIAMKFIGLLSNKDFYALRRWRIPTAAPPIHILQFYFITLTWQHIQSSHSLAYFWLSYRYFCDFPLIYDNQCNILLSTWSKCSIFLLMPASSFMKHLQKLFGFHVSESLFLYNYFLNIFKNVAYF